MATSTEAANPPAESAPKVDPQPVEPESKSDSGDASKTSSPKGKSSNKVVIIVGVIVVLLLLCSCGVGAMFYFGFGIFSDKVTEEAVENLVEDAIEEGIESDSEGDVDVDLDEGSMSFESDEGSFEFGTASEWPDDMPSEVPEFEYGDIESVITSSEEGYEYWTVGFENVDNDAADKYHDDLIAEGWAGGTTGSYDAVYVEELTNGDLTMVFSYDSDADAFSIVVERES